MPASGCFIVSVWQHCLLMVQPWQFSFMLFGKVTMPTVQLNCIDICQALFSPFKYSTVMSMIILYSLRFCQNGSLQSLFSCYLIFEIQEPFILRCLLEKVCAILILHNTVECSRPQFILMYIIVSADYWEKISKNIYPKKLYPKIFRNYVCG